MMDKRYPSTVGQRQLLIRDITEIRGKLEDLAGLVRCCCGDKADACVRAEETLAALQRLQWVLERELPEFSKSESP